VPGTRSPRRFGVLAPQASLVRLIDARQLMRLDGADPPALDSQPQHRRPEHRDCVQQSRQSEVIQRRRMLLCRLKRAGRLLTRQDAGGGLQLHAQRIPRPVAQRRPRPILQADQFLRRIGEMAEQIGAGVFRNLRRHLGPHLGRTIQRDVGEAEGMHVGKIDMLGLRIPLGGDGARQRFRRQHEHLLRRRAQRLAIQLHAPAAPGRNDAGLLVKPTRPAFELALHLRHQRCLRTFLR
jgi:hypothetical protein